MDVNFAWYAANDFAQNYTVLREQTTPRVVNFSGIKGAVGGDDLIGVGLCKGSGTIFDVREDRLLRLMRDPSGNPAAIELPLTADKFYPTRESAAHEVMYGGSDWVYAAGLSLKGLNPIPEEELGDLVARLEKAGIDLNDFLPHVQQMVDPNRESFSEKLFGPPRQRILGDLTDYLDGVLDDVN
tara:strand:- start:125 stop:676 length:552 start_codon:yes stop_codon:yes gene_type:complete